MKVEKLAPIVEVVGVAAILVTLIFLTIQTRQNTLAIQANSRQMSESIGQQLLFTQMENPSLWTRMHEGNFTDEEKVYFSAWLVAFFSLRQTDWYNYRNGTLDEVAWNGQLAVITQVLSQQSFRVWWKNFSPDVYHPEFQALVNQAIDESPPRSDNNILRTFE